MRKNKENPMIDLHSVRERLLGMVAGDEATFSVAVNEKHRDELVDVTIEYEVSGVHYDREDGKLKLILNINSMDPAEVSIKSEKLTEILAGELVKNIPFLLKDTYTLYFDADSVKSVNRKGKLRRFRQDLAYAIPAYGITLDEALPIVMEFVTDSLADSSFESLEDIQGARKSRGNPPVLEITPPGVPCPHCRGILSEDALHRLLTRIYMMQRHSDREDY